MSSSPRSIRRGYTACDQFGRNWCWHGFAERKDMEGYRIPILNSLYLSITYGFNDLYIWLCRVSLQNACRMLAECLQNHQWTVVISYKVLITDNWWSSWCLLGEVQISQQHSRELLALDHVCQAIGKFSSSRSEGSSGHVPQTFRIKVAYVRW